MRLADIVPMRLATFTYPEQHPLAGQGGLVFGYAVPFDDGILLVDTGIAAHPDMTSSTGRSGGISPRPSGTLG